MQAIPIDIIKYEIVSSANEDLTGLYEVIWALNFQFPNIANLNKIEYSKLAITELLQKDIVELYRKNWNTQVENKIEKANALEIVMQNDAWEVTSNTNNEYYCFFTNGNKALEEQSKLYVQLKGG